MANEQNLKPARTPKEARERGKKGGIASGVARRKKRSMKEALKTLMDMPVTFENIGKQLLSMGFSDDELTNQIAVAVSMFKEAMAGNVKAAEFIRDTIGDGAADEDRKEKLKIERERLKIEQERLKYQLEKNSGTGEGMPTIINVRPGEDDE